METQAKDVIKEILFNSFMEKYNTLIQEIRKAPLSPYLSNIIIQHIDTGMLWAKEAYGVMVIPDVPSDPPKDEVNTINAG